MKRIVSALLAVAIVSITGFHDWNGNGRMDAGETYAEGIYMLHTTAADGAVSLTVVHYPSGVPYSLQVADGDQVEALSGCGSWAVDVSQPAMNVPVICRAVFLPVVVVN